MFDKNKLKYYALCKNKSMVEIVEALSIDKSTLWRQMSGSSDFSREEVQKIKEFLSLSNEQAMEIFLANSLRKRKKEDVTSGIKIFENPEFGSIRTVEINNEP